MLAMLVLLAQSSPADIEAGKATFRIYCSPCHGRNAEGGPRGPDLTLRGERDPAQVIADGVPGSEMRAYRSTFSTDNVERLVAYIRSRERAPEAVAGNAAAGERIFWGKGGCGACHLVGERGKHFGPDLTRIGRARGLANLRESTVNPDADLVGGYRGVSVTTRDGKTIRGRELGYDAFSVRLADSNGAYHSFLRDEVASVAIEKRSLMPAFRGSPSELNDLLAYLSSLKGDSR
ncbi:MAG: c-type cytochrome [Bryobacteraceae bacterium]|nr:c-type cytochrome [Bryobacteraceae bacterium]